MQIKSVLTSAIALTLLSGCDLVEPITEMVRTQMAGVTIVLPPAVELEIGEDQIVHVVGYDKCPDQEDSFLQYDHSMTLLPNGCINLSNEVEEVRVSMRTKDTDIIEVWKVTHDGDALTLTRPNGFEVREPIN